MFCIEYSSKFTHFNDERVTEVKVQCDGTLSNMQQLCESMRNKTMILYLYHGFDNTCTRNLIELKKTHNNFKALIPIDGRPRSFLKMYEQQIQWLQENNIPFFFDTYVNDWETLHMFADVGVTDMYIVENLCFELDAVHMVLRDKGIKVRVFPNVAQSKYKYDEYSFFIRPEDRQTYDPYVDTYELFKNPDVYNMNTLFSIYADTQKWLGDLRDLIIGLQVDLDSRFIIPTYAERRLMCGKRCLKGKACRLCHRVVKLAETLEEAGLIVKAEVEK